MESRRRWGGEARGRGEEQEEERSGAAGQRKEKKGREKKRKEEKEREGEKEKKRRWEDPIAKTRKERRVAAKRQGVGKEKGRGNPRVWRLGGLGPVWGTLSQFETFIFFYKFNLAINFRKRRRQSR